MFKRFKKRSLKSKIFIIAVIALFVVLTAYVLYSNFKPEPPKEYGVETVTYGTVSDTLDVSGAVESGISENFTAIEGVFVQEVFVNIGDKVEKGAQLATFDVSGAAPVLADAKKAYDNALSEYNNAKKSIDSTAAKKRDLADKINKKNAEITALKNEISALEKEIANTEPVTEYVSIPQEQINMIAAQMAQNGATAEQIEQFMAAAAQVKVPVTSTDNKKAEELMKKNLNLAQLNSELTALQAENSVTISTDNQKMLDALKTVADTKKQSYENLKAIYDSMKNGWFAQNEGIITTVNIIPGEKFVPSEEKTSSELDLAALLGGSGVDSGTAALVSSLLGNSKSVGTGTGIVLESYDDMIVNVTVGKADLLKIKTGMEAVVLSVGKEYEGEVVYVGATAAESSGLNLGSITSSIMGGSGSSNGAIVKVKIKNPDKNIVIGFDVDIKIKLSTLENVLKTPVETVIYENGEYFVYVLDSKTDTVSKRKITRGILDDTSYQVLDGLSEGEKVVKTPDPNFTDGTKIREKTA